MDEARNPLAPQRDLELGQELEWDTAEIDLTTTNANELMDS
jgi:hypothetical protein